MKNNKFLSAGMGYSVHILEREESAHYLIVKTIFYIWIFLLPQLRFLTLHQNISKSWVKGKESNKK